MRVRIEIESETGETIVARGEYPEMFDVGREPTIDEKQLLKLVSSTVERALQGMGVLTADVRIEGSL